MTAATPASGSAAIEAKASPGRPATWLAGWRAGLGGPVMGPLVAVAGSGLLALAGLLPVWGTRLVAPQYPKGLELWFYGDRVEGPLQEVNGLNHYIGMQAIDLSRVPEMALWPLAVLGLAALLTVAVLWRGWLSRLALAGLWVIPVTVLADIQRWLIIFATELDPRAALRLEGFVPLVLGPTQVWNFSVLSYPGPALLLMLLVALVATLARRARPPSQRLRLVSAGAGLALAGLGSALLVLPAMAHGPNMAEPGSDEQASALHGSTDHASPDRDGVATTTDLQALVDAAVPGSTLRVPPGTYRTHLVIDRPLTLLAEGEVHLDGSGLGSVVTITADHVTLRGFRVGSTGGQVEVGAAIKVVDADDVSIEANELHDFFHGIAVLGSTNVRISHNVLRGSGLSGASGDHLAEAHPDQSDATSGGAVPRRPAAEASGAGPEGQGDGIYLWHSRAVTIRANRIDAVRDGIYLSFTVDALVDGNTVSDSRYALHAMFGGPVTAFGNVARANLAGLVYMYTHDVLTGRNVLTDHRSAGTGVAVVLKDVRGVRIAENVIARNRVGLRAEGTRRLVDAEAAVLRNRFDSNDTAVALLPSADLGFGANTFEANLTDVHAGDRGVGRQNDWTYQGTGNRWSAYPGYDLDGDAVGDIPHTASGALDVLVARAPALGLYRGSLALHALGSAQELWAAGRAEVVRDVAPRIDDRAARLADLDPAGRAAAAGVAEDATGWLLAGLSLAGLALVGLGLGRARRAGVNG